MPLDVEEEAHQRMLQEMALPEFDHLVVRRNLFKAFAVSKQVSSFDEQTFIRVKLVIWDIPRSF